MFLKGYYFKYCGHAFYFTVLLFELLDEIFICHYGLGRGAMNETVQ